ncbi:MAG: hypothetical protein RLZ12_720 [Bacillota bacterium]|jgi:uncharacterized HAD superfamily protein
MRLGIDLDGTVVDTWQIAVNHFNKLLGKQIDIAEARRLGNFYFLYGITVEHGERLWAEHEETIYRLGKPFPEASEVLSRLVAEGHEVFFITARAKTEGIVQATKEWLVNNKFPYNGNNLIIGAGEKGLIARERGIDLFFEDMPVYLDKLVAANIPVVIFDAPYNQCYDAKVARITSWQEAYDLVLVTEKT